MVLSTSYYWNKLSCIINMEGCGTRWTGKKIHSKLHIKSWATAQFYWCPSCCIVLLYSITMYNILLVLSFY